VNIVTTGNRLVRFVALISIAAGWSGCSSDQPAKNVTGDRTSDIQQIKDVLEETAVRWRYGDKSVLFEQEFQYLKDGFTYDRYLEDDKIKRMESDTVRAFVVKDVRFLDGDSAMVDVDVVFVGPVGDTTRLAQTWPMHYYQGRWIRPTLTNRAGQDQWDERRREADSAAAAEENLGKDDW